MTSGWYYLHKNGDLIYKSGSGSIADIRDSDFCRAAWPLDPQNRKAAWDIVVEAAAIGARRDRVDELVKLWGIDDEDAKNYANALGFALSMDGDQWCATRADFMNLQESPAGFGDTAFDAIVGLCKSLDCNRGKLGWGRTFADACKVEVSA